MVDSIRQAMCETFGWKPSAKKAVRKTVTTIEVAKMIATKHHRPIHEAPPKAPKTFLLRKPTGEEKRIMVWN